MRVLAAAFEDPGAAQSALDDLRDRHGVRAADASIAPLGNVDRARARTVLAGRFKEDALPDIRALLARYGGRVVSEVDERWTHSPAGPESLEPDFDGHSH